jgi:hypothetical protein
METQEYKPTKKEVLTELAKPIKKAGQYIKKALRDNLELYVMPTTFRKSPSGNLNFLGTFGLIDQGIFYEQLICKADIPAYWLPIATNILSGLYETGRYFYKKTEKKVIQSKLENKAK